MYVKHLGGKDLHFMIQYSCINFDCGFNHVSNDKTFNGEATGVSHKLIGATNIESWITLRNANGLCVFFTKTFTFWTTA